MATSEMARSWLHLQAQDPRFQLPESLRRRDPFGARDIGWVEQMRPFLREFSAPGARVIDPFAGFGTTLLAAALEGRSALGYELDAGRAGLASERLAHHEINNSEIRCGELPERPMHEPLFDLALTSVPYFGAQSGLAASESGQLYASHSYQVHLDHLGLLFHRLRAWLKPGAYCVVMAENLRLSDQVLPLAWDLANLLGDLYQRGEERLIVYSSGRQAGANPMFSDRSHEYALVFRNLRLACMRRNVVWPWLQALAGLGLNFALHGSAARHWRDPDSAEPVADVDLVFDPLQPDIERAAAWLHERGFALRSWGRSLSLPLQVDTRLRGRYAVLAERIERDGRRLRFDLGFEVDGVDLPTALAQAERHDGIGFLSD